MNSLDELVAFVEVVLGPGFDLEAAATRLGAIDYWVGALAHLKSAEPALTRVVLETDEGVLHGVQADLVKVLEVPWSDLERSLGPRVEAARVVDAWSGPVPYRFVREDSAPPGVIFLDVTDRGVTAAIERLVVRRGAPSGSS